MKKLKDDKSFLDSCIIFCGVMFVLTAIFGAICFVLWREEPAELFGLVKALCGAEGMFAMCLAVAKLRNKKTEKEDEEEEAEEYDN